MESSSYYVPYIYGKTGQDRKIKVRVPGSKSITNRALLLAMLADGSCTLTGALFSDDSRYLQQCIADLGIDIKAEEEKALIRVGGLGGRLPVKEASVYVGECRYGSPFPDGAAGAEDGRLASGFLGADEAQAHAAPAAVTSGAGNPGGVWGKGRSFPFYPVSGGKTESRRFLWISNTAASF